MHTHGSASTKGAGKLTGLQWVINNHSYLLSSSRMERIFDELFKCFSHSDTSDNDCGVPSAVCYNPMISFWKASCLDLATLKTIIPPGSPLAVINTPHIESVKSAWLYTVFFYIVWAIVLPPILFVFSSYLQAFLQPASHILAGSLCKSQWIMVAETLTDLF